MAKQKGFKMEKVNNGGKMEARDSKQKPKGKQQFCLGLRFGSKGYRVSKTMLLKFFLNRQMMPVRLKKGRKTKRKLLKPII